MKKVVSHPFWQTHGLLVARVFMGLLFLLAAIYKLQGGVAGVEAMIAGVGLPMAGALAWLTLLVEFFGGALLIVGYKVEYAAIALIIFVLLASFFFHPDIQDMNLLKNLAVIGGLMYVVANGTGRSWKLIKN